MAKTKIEWATHSWNPVTGCTPIERCQNCYARAWQTGSWAVGYPAEEPFRVTLHPDLDEPLNGKTPKVFVCVWETCFTRMCR